MMDDFADFLLPTCNGLKPKDCVPAKDTGYGTNYGYVGAPFQLEVVFKPGKIIVTKLFIRSDLKGQGLGRAIVEYLKRECSRLHFREIELDTVLRESAGFWERCGFSINGLYGRWEVHEP